MYTISYMCIYAFKYLCMRVYLDEAWWLDGHFPISIAVCCRYCCYCRWPQSGRRLHESNCGAHEMNRTSGRGALAALHNMLLEIQSHMGRAAIKSHHHTQPPTFNSQVISQLTDRPQFVYLWREFNCSLIGKKLIKFFVSRLCMHGPPHTLACIRASIDGRIHTFKYCYKQVHMYKSECVYELNQYRHHNKHYLFIVD